MTKNNKSVNKTYFTKSVIRLRILEIVLKILAKSYRLFLRTHYIATV